jgi:hypothetical protein
MPQKLHEKLHTKVYDIYDVELIICEESRNTLNDLSDHINSRLYKASSFVMKVSKSILLPRST